MAIFPTQARFRRSVEPSLARAGVGIALLLLLFCTGCLRRVTDLVGDKPLPDLAKPSASAKKTKATSTAAKKALAKTSAPTLLELQSLLAANVVEKTADGKSVVKSIDGWYAKLTLNELRLPPADEYQWKHDALASYLATYSNSKDGLRTAARSDQPFIAATAAIGLARLEPQSSLEPLVKLILDYKLPITLRCAAVETLAHRQQVESATELRALLAIYSELPERRITEPKVFAELLKGLARHADAAHEPEFIEALERDIPDLQVTSLVLIAASKPVVLPDEVVRLAENANARVRRAAFQLLAVTNDPQALPLLQAGTRDGDLTARLTAIESLGRLSDDDSLALLYDLLRDPMERHREAAASAMIMRREWPAIQRAATDPSYRVRAAVAEGIATHGDPQRLELARQLLTDSSAVVQAKQAKSLAQWPTKLAVPLLLDALASPNQMTRVAASESLEKIWKEAGKFPATESAANRAPKLAALRQRWQSEHPEAVAIASGDALSTKAVSEADKAEVKRLLRQYQSPPKSSPRWLAHKQLERRGKALLPVLIVLAEETDFTLDEAVYRELLPEISPEFATIEQLRSSDVAIRRAAGRQLVAIFKLDPPTRLALQRIEQLTKDESDALVWADLLRIAVATPDYVAHELALAALANGEADIRRRGCEYLATHGEQRQADALLELLDDRDPVVRKAAVVALGRCGPARSIDRLVKLLSDRDVALQIAAAKTLTQWSDERGAATLERLALAPQAATRRAALQAMGELADDQFLPAAMKALDDETSVLLAALKALPLIVGDDPVARLQPPPVGAHERAAAWKAVKR